MSSHSKILQLTAILGTTLRDMSKIDPKNTPTPKGPLYAGVMGQGFSLNEFDTAMALLLKLDVITLHHPHQVAYKTPQAGTPGDLFIKKADELFEKLAKG
jgi:hypothetical protein